MAKKRVSRDKLRELHAKGLNNLEISKEARCSPSTVSKILRELGLTANKGDISYKHPLLLAARSSGSLAPVEGFISRRCGVVLPGPNTPGYYLILGLKSSEKTSLILLAEGARHGIGDFFSMVALRLRRWKVEKLFINHKGLADIESAVASIQQYRRDGALAIPEKTILARQLGELDEVNNNSIAALIKVLKSFL